MEPFPNSLKPYASMRCGVSDLDQIEFHVALRSSSLVFVDNFRISFSRPPVHLASLPFLRYNRLVLCYFEGSGYPTTELLGPGAEIYSPPKIDYPPVHRRGQTVETGGNLREFLSSRSTRSSKQFGSPSTSFQQISFFIRTVAPGVSPDVGHYAQPTGVQLWTFQWTPTRIQRPTSKELTRRKSTFFSTYFPINSISAMVGSPRSTLANGPQRNTRPQYPAGHGEPSSAPPSRYTNPGLSLAPMEGHSTCGPASSGVTLPRQQSVPQRSTHSTLSHGQPPNSPSPVPTQQQSPQSHIDSRRPPNFDRLPPSQQSSYTSSNLPSSSYSPTNFAGSYDWSGYDRRFSTDSDPADLRRWVLHPVSH